MQALIVGKENKKLSSDLNSIGFKINILTSLKDFDKNSLDQESPCLFYRNPNVSIENPKVVWDFNKENNFKYCTIKKEIVSFIPKYAYVQNDTLYINSDQKESFEIRNLKFEDKTVLPKVAATYVVYEDSGFLEESVSRIYPLVDKILFLLSTRPWNGEPDNSLLQKTYRTILDFNDPDNKMEIVSKCWKTETEQRNFGLKYLEKQDIDWTWLIDDDEMYNLDQAKAMLDKIKNEKETYYGYGVSWVVYWKSKEHYIDVLETFPTFIYNKNAQTFFNENRMILVPNMKKYRSVPREELVCHHYSYIRSDEKMFRKINSFSHKDQIYAEWYDKVWLKWHPAMEDIHPTNPTAFKKARPISESRYQLEDWKPISKVG